MYLYEIRNLLYYLKNRVLIRLALALVPLLLCPQPSSAVEQPDTIPDAWMNGYPQYWQGIVYAQFSFWDERYASGVVATPRGIVTAGHAVYDRQSRSWAYNKAFMRWNHGTAPWPSLKPAGWDYRKMSFLGIRSRHYSSGPANYTSFNQDFGGLLFNSNLMSNGSFMRLRAARNDDFRYPRPNADNIIIQRLNGNYTKSVMCYPHGRYGNTHSSKWKLHETLPQLPFNFSLPPGAPQYDSVGHRAMWRTSPGLRANGIGCSGGSLQTLPSSNNRKLLGVVISDSTSNGLGVRAFGRKGVKLVRTLDFFS